MWRGLERENGKPRSVGAGLLGCSGVGLGHHMRTGRAAPGGFSEGRHQANWKKDFMREKRRKKRIRFPGFPCKRFFCNRQCASRIIRQGVRGRHGVGPENGPSGAGGATRPKGSFAKAGPPHAPRFPAEADIEGAKRTQRPPKRAKPAPQNGAKTLLFSVISHGKDLSPALSALRVCPQAGREAGGGQNPCRQTPDSAMNRKKTCPTSGMVSPTRRRMGGLSVLHRNPATKLDTPKASRAQEFCIRHTGAPPAAAAPHRESAFRIVASWRNPRPRSGDEFCFPPCG